MTRRIPFVLPWLRNSLPSNFTFHVARSRKIVPIYFLNSLIPGFGEQIPSNARFVERRKLVSPLFFFFFFYPARRNYEVAAGATPASRRHPASNRIRAPLPACAPCLQLVNKSARTTRCLATITFSLATCATEILSTREEEEEEGEGRGIGPRRHKQNSRTVTRRDRLIFDNDENIARSRYQKRIRLFFLSFPFLFPFLCSSLLLSSRREK